MRLYIYYNRKVYISHLYTLQPKASFYYGTLLFVYFHTLRTECVRHIYVYTSYRVFYIYPYNYNIGGRQGGRTLTGLSTPSRFSRPISAPTLRPSQIGGGHGSRTRYHMGYEPSMVIPFHSPSKIGAPPGPRRGPKGA